MDTLLEAIDVCNVDGFCFGNYTDEEAGTGCTVIVAPEGATGGVDVRGGAPASRETDLLRPENTVDKVHAVCLSGGSAFGLEAASGVARELESRGIGLPVGPTQVPIVCSSCIFDLAFGDPTVRPDIEAGIAAVREALAGGQFFDVFFRLDLCFYIQAPEVNQLWQDFVNAERVELFQPFIRRSRNGCIGVFCHDIGDVLKHLKALDVQCRGFLCIFSHRLLQCPSYNVILGLPVRLSTFFSRRYMTNLSLRFRAREYNLDCFS